MHFLFKLKVSTFQFCIFKHGFGGDHPIRCNRIVKRLFTTRANDYDMITNTAIELSSERHVSRLRSNEIHLLELRKARLQACIDTAYLRLRHSLHLSAIETLEI